MSTPPTTPIEFSRIILVDGLTGRARPFAVAADARERSALAERFGLLDVGRVDVAGAVSSVRGGTVVQMAAHLSAEVTQACIVTLVPVRQRIEVDFVRFYAQDGPAELEPGSELHFDEGDEDIDPLVNGRLDVGEAAAEQLALELDPYPRAPHAAVNGEDVGEMNCGDDPQTDEPRVRPFADLASLSIKAGARKKRK